MNRRKEHLKRFGVTLIANITRGLVTIIIGIILARYFGANDYGRIVFLTAAFVALKQILDLGSSSAFYTFLSQKERSKSYINYFWLFFSLKYLFSSIVIFLVLPSDITSIIFAGENDDLIAIAFVATVIQFDLWQIAAQMPESQRKTLQVQLLYIISLLCQLTIIYSLYLFEILTLQTYFVTNAIVWMLASLAAINYYSPTAELHSNDSFADVFKGYIKFCKPIAPLLILGVLAEFFDRWMLQTWGGAEQQSFYAIAQQISSVSLIVTASVIKIFWKEIAQALNDGNTCLAETYYNEVKKAVFFVSSFIVCGLIFWVDELVLLLYGGGYVGVNLTLLIMLLYSLHQSIGQVESAFVLASGQTRIGVVLNFIMTPVGLLFSYILLSPDVFGSPGVALGSEGYAIKLFILNIISANFLGFLICRKFKWRFNFVYQIKMTVTFMVISLFCKSLFTAVGNQFGLTVIVPIFAYALMVLLVIYFKPGILCVENMVHNLSRSNND